MAVFFILQNNSYRIPKMKQHYFFIIIFDANDSYIDTVVSNCNSNCIQSSRVFNLSGGGFVGFH